MNFKHHTRLARSLMIGGAIATLAACQNPHSRFTDSSQGTLVADTKPGASGQTGMAREAAGTPEGIARYGGHFYYIHNRTAVRLYQRQRFVEGYTYDGRGHIISTSGNLVHLSEGEMVTFGGDRLPLPPGLVN